MTQPALPTREAFDRLIAEMRPKLHRYCARMSGSVIDGEDIVQDTVIKALEALPQAPPITNPEGWLFRIAHNTALDFLRRKARLASVHADEELDMIVDPVMETHAREAAAASLRTFMRLPVAQRSSVILKDVLGHSLEEIGAMTGATIPAVKAALHRGREQLHTLAQEPDDTRVPALAETDRAQLAAYIDRFNARDVEALRTMLAQEIQVDLVGRRQMTGPEARRYFSNYEKVHDWLFVPGFVDGRPAALVRDPDDPDARPMYFVLLEWEDGQVVRIRDFRHARYAIEDASVVVL